MLGFGSRSVSSIRFGMFCWSGWLGSGDVVLVGGSEWVGLGGRFCVGIWFGVGLGLVGCWPGVGRSKGLGHEVFGVQLEIDSL